MAREALKDDVIPLFKPIVTNSGKTISEIAVAKGTQFEISVDGYNTCVNLPIHCEILVC